MKMCFVEEFLKRLFRWPLRVKSGGCRNRDIGINALVLGINGDT